MELNVDINADDIQKEIVSAIAKSAIGAELQRTIEAEVSHLATNYKNPMGKVIRDEIERMVHEIVVEKYTSQIREWIAEKVTEEFTVDMFNKMWEVFANRY